MTTATETKAESGELTKADEYRRELSADLAEAMDELEERRRVWDDLKADTKEAKADHDAAQREVNRIGKEIKALRDGTFQPRLIPHPPSNGKPADATSTAPAPVDEGAAMPISKLTEYETDDGRVSAKMCELLTASKFDIKTIGHLERTIRENEWWSRDIEGVGPKGIDKVISALAAFRQQHPMPTVEEATDAQPATEGESVQQADAETTDTSEDSE